MGFTFPVPTHPGSSGQTGVIVVVVVVAYQCITSRIGYRAIQLHSRKGVLFSFTDGRGMQFRLSVCHTGGSVKSPVNVVSGDIRVMQIFAGVREIWVSNKKVVV